MLFLLLPRPLVVGIRGRYGQRGDLGRELEVLVHEGAVPVSGVEALPDDLAVALEADVVHQEVEKLDKEKLI